MILLISVSIGQPVHLKTKVTLLTGTTDSHVDDFVSSLWKHMEGWGIALAGGYWKPVLRFEVAPGGERRYAELQALLRDSGLEFTRK